jgi:pimeloyl-ACP methyl ester carboxylesterase
MRRRFAHHPVAVSEDATDRNAERNRSMNPTMNTRGDASTNHERTTASRRQAVQGLGALTLALLSLSRLRSTAAQEATPEGSDPLATWAPGQMATINGADLYYEVHGDPNGQPVLLLHGSLNSSEQFDYLAPVLVAAGYRVVAMDCRGRGRSAWGDLPITFEQMAADAVGLLDHLGIEKTHVVGSSDGAIIALDLATHHSERLDRVVAYGAILNLEGNQFVESDQMPPFEFFIATYRRLSPEPERFEELLGVLDELTTAGPNYSEADLKSITVPVLILDGAEDEFITPDQPVRLAELIPEATLVIMPGTGHFATNARPGLFNQIVLEYLAGKTPSGAATPPASTPTS